MHSKEKKGRVHISKKRLSKRIMEHWILYLFLLPCIASFIIFSYIPMAGLVMAFKEFKFNMGMFRSPWVGFLYFERYFSYHNAWGLIRNTFTIGILKIIIEFPFPIIFALLLNEVRSKSFKKVTQTISYLPHFISWVVVAGIVHRLLAPSPNDGFLNYILTNMRGEEVDTFYLMEPRFYYWIIFFTDMWKGIGWGSIIYLAAITNINPLLYEAARIDGANKLRQIWHITLPGIRPTISILLILGLGGILSTGFEQPYLFRTPGNAVVADILPVYVILAGLRQGQYGYATAVGLMQGIVGLIFVLVANYFSKKVTEVGIW